MWYSVLLHKFHCCGIPCKLCTWISSYLSEGEFPYHKDCFLHQPYNFLTLTTCSLQLLILSTLTQLTAPKTIPLILNNNCKIMCTRLSKDLEATLNWGAKNFLCNSKHSGLNNIHCPLYGKTGSRLFLSNVISIGINTWLS